MLAILPVIHIGRATHSYMKETHLSGIHMDREFETMNAQVTRNGIFARDSIGARVRRWFGMK